MDAFLTHQKVINNYKEYLQSFINIQDERIKEYVEKSTMAKDLLPEPLVQFNPSYAKSETFEDLVEEGIIESDLLNAVNLFPPFRHQVEAIRLGVQGKGFIVTSGTGSGKSLTYISTVFNEVLKKGKDKKTGIKAIFVYPMNALINSQKEELKKYEERYIQKTGKPFPISFAEYTGQTTFEEKEYIQNNKPDIILTNYMMLELLMTRKNESWFWESIENNLEFLVYDELHTYRGRQGADVSILNRRIQSVAKKELITIGTSATMASKGTPLEKKQIISNVAETIFGKRFEIDQIINEYLEPSTNAEKVSDLELKEAIEKGININDSESEFIKNKLANWIELNIALKENEGTLERGRPMSIPVMVKIIKEKTGISDDNKIREVIIELLKWAEKINADNRAKGVFKSYIPFRLHQFISQTGSISVTLQSRKKRSIFSSEEPYVKINNTDKLLYPLMFSRYSGYDFLKVELNFEDYKIEPARIEEEFENEGMDPNAKEPDWENYKYGYIVLDEKEEFWEDDFYEFIPETWFKNNGTELKPHYEMVMPQRIYFNENGSFSLKSSNGYELKGYFLPSPLRIDPTASVIYEDARTKDNTKLSRLGSEGRSTATSVLSYSIVNALIDQGESYKDQKLLSFTDNRQDASLQAGHFNDFFTTIRFRSALYNCIKNKEYNFNELARKILETLGLKEKDYARNPVEDEDFPDEENKEAMVLLMQYRLLQDLKRGWRYTMPNLEQVGLLSIKYYQLEKLPLKKEYFEGIEMLNRLEQDELYYLLKNILDYFRTNTGLSDYFYKEKTRHLENIRAKIKEETPWTLAKEEKIEDAKVMSIQPIPRNFKNILSASIGSRSNLGKYLQRFRVKYGYERLNKEEYEHWLSSILEVLKRTGFIVKYEDRRIPEHEMYQLKVSRIRWSLNKDETPLNDKIRLNFYNELIELQANTFFKDLYKKDFTNYPKELIAREHTGQISNLERIEREEDFREGKIATMYCSPTMELGIDISNLNIVHMRNVPPNAANYAQRGGRAGRSGQTALVFTYCSNKSPHDVHYFKNSEEMVAGIVEPPNIDLKNEDLVSSHLNAFLLMHLNIHDLKNSAYDVLDLSDKNNIQIKSEIIDEINTQINQNKLYFVTLFKNIIDNLGVNTENTNWYSENWIERKIEQFSITFEKSFERWIVMFKNANALVEKAQSIIDNHTIRTQSAEKKEAESQERFARRQIEKLKNDGRRGQNFNSEFYVFRYLAAEGFLPGYNFTRLPIRAMLGEAFNNNVEVISRPKKLALNEFGPRNIIYHSGSKYRMNRMIVTDIENIKESMRISTDTGYVFLNDEVDTANVDPITQIPLKGPKVTRIGNLIPLSESEGFPVQKITSIEEERSRLGFEINTYFNYPKGIESAQSIILQKDGEKLLQLYFNAATQLVSINNKPKRSKSEGFKINPENGKWLLESDLENAEIREKAQEVFLYTTDTADTLYIQPLENIGTSPEQIISLSYALKRGIERLFLVEENEIDVSIIGNPEKPNILLYEAAEGSLGILSQLVQGTRMKEWFEESYKAMHFDLNTFEETEKSKNLPKASYEDLLSYYNQIYHKSLDRFAVKEILEQLIGYEMETIQNEGRTREEQYKYLLENYDSNSDLELQFLKHLYKNNYELPDKAQVNLKDYYINADFIYNNNGNISVVFIDGSVHDTADVKNKDMTQRELLRSQGYDVIVWRYDEPLEKLLKERKDVFRKV